MHTFHSAFKRKVSEFHKCSEFPFDALLDLFSRKIEAEFCMIYSFVYLFVLLQHAMATDVAYSEFPFSRNVVVKFYIIHFNSFFIQTTDNKSFYKPAEYYNSYLFIYLFYTRKRISEKAGGASHFGTPEPKWRIFNFS